LDELFHALTTAEARGPIAAGEGLQQIIETFNRSGLAVVISDLFSSDDACFEMLKQLRAQRQQVIVFHIVSPEEVDFDFQGEFLMEDGETGEKIPVHAESFRAEYQARVQAFFERAERTCETLEIDYHRLRTDERLDRALALYLEERMAR
jgi:hypothetical protein